MFSGQDILEQQQPITVRKCAKIWPRSTAKLLVKQLEQVKKQNESLAARQEQEVDPQPSTSATKKKDCARISVQQKLALLNYWRKHPEIGTMGYGYKSSRFRQLWQNLADILNSTPGKRKQHWLDWRKEFRAMRNVAWSRNDRSVDFYSEFRKLIEKSERYEQNLKKAYGNKITKSEIRTKTKGNTKRLRDVAEIQFNVINEKAKARKLYYAQKENIIIKRLKILNQYAIAKENYYERKLKLLLIKQEYLKSKMFGKYVNKDIEMR